MNALKVGETIRVRLSPLTEETVPHIVSKELVYVQLPNGDYVANDSIEASEHPRYLRDLLREYVGSCPTLRVRHLGNGHVEWLDKCGFFDTTSNVATLQVFAPDERFLASRVLQSVRAEEAKRDDTDKVSNNS